MNMHEYSNAMNMHLNMHEFKNNKYTAYMMQLYNKRTFVTSLDLQMLH